MTRIVAACALASFLSGCAITGMREVVDSKGPVDKDTTGLVGAFNTSEKQSFDNSSVSLHAAAMFNSGYALVQDGCETFFKSAGQRQGYVLVARDLVTAGGSVASAVLALHERSANSISNVALGTATTIAGLDLYTKHFLFAAENVDSVKQLVLRAMDAHAAKVNEQAGTLTYTSAMGYLLANQAICSYASIRSLAVQAIAAGKVDAIPEPNLSVGQPVQDHAVLRSLGGKLAPPAPVSPDQAFALWWLLQVPAGDDATEIKEQVCPRLKALPDKTTPCKADGTYKADWALEDAVRDDLDSFSALTKSALNAQVAEERKKKAAKAGKSRGAAADVTPLLALPGAAQRAGRIGLQVR